MGNGTIIHENFMKWTRSAAVSCLLGSLLGTSPRALLYAIVIFNWELAILEINQVEKTNNFHEKDSD
jgi:hypothetical protein